MDRRRGCGLTVTRLGETTRTASAGLPQPASEAQRRATTPHVHTWAKGRSTVGGDGPTEPSPTAETTNRGDGEPV